MRAKQMKVSEQTPVTVKVTLFAIFTVGILWVGFSFLMAFSPFSSFSRLGFYRWIMAGMTFAAGAGMIVLWVLLRNRRKIAWYLAVIALSLMSVAIVFDQVGWVDVLVMLASAMPLALIIIDRKWYLKT